MSAEAVNKPYANLVNAELSGHDLRELSYARAELRGMIVDVVVPRGSLIVRAMHSFGRFWLLVDIADCNYYEPVMFELSACGLGGPLPSDRHRDPHPHVESGEWNKLPILNADGENPTLYWRQKARG